MDARRFPVGVYALDRNLPAGADGSRLLALGLDADTLARDLLAETATLHLAESPEGLVLDAAVTLSGRMIRAGSSVAFDRVAAGNGAIAVWIADQPVALAAASTGGLVVPGPEAAVQLSGFARGTRIDTPEGLKPVESLQPGDLVSTLDNGSQPLVWVGKRHVALPEMLAVPELRPVRFSPGAMGNGDALVVSARQRMLVDDWRAEVYFAEDRVLVDARALVDDRQACLDVPVTGLECWLLLCPRHEILIAEGALSESFHPGEAGYAGLGPSDRAVVEALVPEADVRRRRAACPIVRNAEARALRLPG